MTPRRIQVTFDCVSPRTVGRFWCEALGYEPARPPGGFRDWDEFRLD